MILVAQDASESPIQEFTLSTEQRVHIMQLSLWVYANDIQNADTFEINIYDSNAALVWTKALTGSLIKSYINGSNTYSHGKLNIDTQNELIIGAGVYELELVQLTGFTASNYLSWCRDWESTYQETYGAIVNDSSDPFYLRIYDLKGREVST